MSSLVCMSFDVLLLVIPGVCFICSRPKKVYSDMDQMKALQQMMMEDLQDTSEDALDTWIANCQLQSELEQD